MIRNKKRDSIKREANEEKIGGKIRLRIVHVGGLDADNADGKALQLTTRQVLNVAIENVLEVERLRNPIKKKSISIRKNSKEAKMKRR